MKIIFKNAIALFLLFFFISNTLHAKTLVLEHKGSAYWASFYVTWTQYNSPQSKNFEGVGEGWTETLTLADNASNIKVRVETNKFLGIYSEACSKTIGNQGGTFTLSGLLHSESCKFVASEGSNTQVAGNVDPSTMDILTPSGSTQLLDAVNSKDIASVRALIDAGTSHVSTPNRQGITPLHKAVQLGDIELIEILLRAGADVNKGDMQGNDPFYLAVSQRKKDIVQKFIDNGYLPDAKCIDKAVKGRDAEMVSLILTNDYSQASNILNLAMETNQAEMMQTAIEFGAVPTTEVFLKAVNTNKLQMAESILENPSSVIDYNEAMKQVIAKNNKQMVSKVLAKGGDPNAALNYAVKSRDQVIANDAISMYGADANSVLEEVIKTNQIQLLDVLLNNNVNTDQALTYAVDQKNKTIIQTLIGRGAVVSDSHISKTASEGQDDILKVLIMEGNGNPNAGLQPALNAKKFSTAEQLIQAGASPDGVVEVAVENKQKTLLMTALDNGADPQPGIDKAIDIDQVEYVKLLVDKGASVSDSHVSKAASAGNDAILNVLINEGAGNPDAGIQAALSAKRFSSAEFLIKAGASPDGAVKVAVENQQKNLLNTALAAGASPQDGLAAAINANFSDFSKLLIESGATTDDRDLVNKVIANNDLTLLSLMLQNGTSADTGFQYAIEQNKTEFVELLISNGANVSKPEFMEKAAELKNEKIVQMLLTSGAIPDPGMMPAVNGNSAPLVELLLKSGADGTSSDLLIASVPHNNKELSSLLITAGSDGSVALGPSIQNGANNVLEVVVESGVDVSDPQHLTQAVQLDFVGIASILIQNGSDPLYIDNLGNTYLHLSADNSDAPMVSLLATAGVDVNAVNSAGDTALHIAVKRGKDADDFVSTMINAGADVNAANGQGQFPLDVAKSGKVKKLLKKAGASKS